MSFWDNPFALIAQWLTGVLIGWGLSADWVQLILALAGAFTVCLLAMLFVIFLIWYERKLIGRIQDRFGPNRVGPWGIFQPFADMLKIFTKEYITPQGADRVPYNLAPVLSVAAVLLLWAVIPFSVTMYGVNLSVGVVYIIGAGGLSVMALLLAGYGSNNKYSLMAGTRAVAQMISYEVPMILALIIPVMLTGSLGINDIVKAQSVPFLVTAPVAALLFFVSLVAEGGRSPFDLVEAESELVAGFNTEYSGLKFGMFYVAEFLHAFTASLIFSTLFLSGWRGPFAEQIPLLGFVYLTIKTFLVYFILILFRGSLPRFRIDQMMNLNWKMLVPLALVNLVATALVARPIDGLPRFWQVLILLAVNGVVMGIFLELVEKGLARKHRPIVGKPRPLARPTHTEENISA